MMKVLTASQMGEVDRRTSERYGIPSLLLMENAGRSVVEELERTLPLDLDKHILILCGTGNNGGDGLVVGRLLVSRGHHPEIWVLGDASRFKGDALENWRMIQALGLAIHVLPDGETRSSRLRATKIPEIIIDAIFGTGLSKPIGADFREIVEWVNHARPRAFVASVDLPSGVFADSSDLPGVAVQADLTVTFTSMKAALVFPPASRQAGKVTVAAIGSPASLLNSPEYRTSIIDGAEVRRVLPKRARDSHKGTFGHVFILAGSRDKSGAALMSGMAALRSGAGLVTLMLPESLREDMVGKFPELMTVWLEETSEGTASASASAVVLDQLAQANAVIVGPGLSTNASTRELVREVVTRAAVPVVLDADGINAFAGKMDLLGNASGNPVIITPHPGEMARLLDLSIPDIQSRRIEIAAGSAQKQNLYVILKGFQTLVASPSGDVFINPTGNPGMATGGTGDILAGMTGRFAAGWQRRSGKSPAAHLGHYLAAAVYLHGRAGDLAALEKGEESLIATDLLETLPRAFKGVWQP